MFEDVEYYVVTGNSISCEYHCFRKICNLRDCTRKIERWGLRVNKVKNSFRLNWFVLSCNYWPYSGTLNFSHFSHCVVVNWVISRFFFCWRIYFSSLLAITELDIEKCEKWKFYCARITQRGKPRQLDVEQMSENFLNEQNIFLFFQYNTIQHVHNKEWSIWYDEKKNMIRL